MSEVLTGYWGRIRQVFEEIVELDDEERRPRLDALAEDEPTVYREVRALLAFDGDADETLTSLMALDEAERRELGALQGTAPGASSTDGSGAALGVGSRLGAYRLVDVLGQGGSSRVYRAVRDDREYDQDVAIKVLRGGRFGAFGIERVRRERQILAALDHPAIARLTDGGTVEGMPYLVMELVDGLPITEHCETKGLGLEDRLSLFLEVLDGVQYAHRHLVVHRDLKPANILVRNDGGPKLLDFGIAKLLSPDEFGLEPDETRTGMLMMTPSFAAPEQVQGRPVTTVSDVYSLGVVLYRLLTNQKPYDADSQDLADIMRAVCVDEPTLPSRADGPWQGRLAGDLDHILMKALAKQPEDRYESVGAFAQDIRRHLSGLPVEARAAGWSYRLGKFARRHRVIIGAAILVFVSFVAALANGIRQYQATQDALSLARTETYRAKTVNDFLIYMVTSVDPREGRGKDVRLLEAIERGEPQLATFFEDEPQVEATVRQVLGAAYRAMDDLDIAEHQLRRALALIEAEDSELEASVRHELGRILLQTGRTDEAERILVPLAVDASGGPSFQYGWTSIALATQMAEVLVERNELDQTTFWIDAALDEAEKLETAPVGSYSSLLDAAAYFAATAGDEDKALKLGLRALEGLRREYGDRSYRTALTHLRVATRYGELGDYSSAVEHSRGAAASFESLVGEKHRLTARAYQTLGLNLKKSGQWEEALQWYRRSLASLQSTLPAGHQEVVYLQLSIGRLYLDRGQLHEAADLIEPAVDVVGELNNVGSPIYNLALGYLGRLRRAQERWAEAETLMRRVLELRLERFGDRAVRPVGFARRDLGLLLMETGRLEESLAELTQAADIVRQTGSAAERGRLEILAALARCMLLLGDAGGALATARQAIEAAGDDLWVQESFCRDLHQTGADASGRLGDSEASRTMQEDAKRCLAGGSI